MDLPDVRCHECGDLFYTWSFAGIEPGSYGVRVAHPKGAKREVFVRPWTHVVCVHSGCLGAIIRKGLSPIDSEYAKRRGQPTPPVTAASRPTEGAGDIEIRET